MAINPVNKPQVDASIVVACYNEEPHLERSVNEIIRVMKDTRFSYELIFVDDVSTDKTREVIQRLLASVPNARALFHEKNTGRGKTVTDGIQMAHGKAVGFLDIDLEVHARYLPSMIAPILDGEADVVTGRRIYKVELLPSALVRHFLSTGYRALVRPILALPVKDTETGYKFFQREKILPVLAKCQSPGWFWDTEVVALAIYEGLRILEVPVLFIRDMEKQSTVKIFRDTFRYLGELRRFSKKNAANVPPRPSIVAPRIEQAPSLEKTDPAGANGARRTLLHEPGLL